MLTKELVINKWRQKQKLNFLRIKDNTLHTTTGWVGIDYCKIFNIDDITGEFLCENITLNNFITEMRKKGFAVTLQ